MFIVHVGCMNMIACMWLCHESRLWLDVDQWWSMIGYAFATGKTKYSFDMLSDLLTCLLVDFIVSLVRWEGDNLMVAVGFPQCESCFSRGPLVFQVGWWTSQVKSVADSYWQHGVWLILCESSVLTVCLSVSQVQVAGNAYDLYGHSKTLLHILYLSLLSQLSLREGVRIISSNVICIQYTVSLIL